LLRIENLHAGYADLEVLHGVDIEVNEGEIVALIGANGAGKTTTLRAISGVIPVSSGSITFEGSSIDSWRSAKIVAEGIVQVPEARKLFPDMSVTENLRLGAYRRGRSEMDATFDEVFELFPRLQERESQIAGTLSGGEQQMLAIGRALMTKPRFLMLDEPSLGLAPQIVQQMYDIIRMLGEKGMTVLLVEQNAVVGLSNADWGSVLDLGKTLFEGPASEILADPRIQELYLGKSANAA